MRSLTMHLGKLVIVVIVGGLLGATLVRCAPGFGVDEEELDVHLNHESQQALRQTSGIREPLASYYIHFLGRILHGDLGVSRTLQIPVQQLLKQRFPETITSVGCGLALGWLLGITLAIVPIILRSSAADLLSSLAAAIALSVPSAMLALLFVLGHAPGRLVIGLIVFPNVFRYARNLLRQSAAQPHVLTAWAKGIGRVNVVSRHVLRTIAPQLLALAGISVSVAFAAAIPVEVICDLPGLGQLAWKAAMGRDLVLLVDLTMIVTVITLIANAAAEMLMQGSQTGEA